MKEFLCRKSSDRKIARSNITENSFEALKWNDSKYFSLKNQYVENEEEAAAAAAGKRAMKKSFDGYYKLKHVNYNSNNKKEFICRLLTRSNVTQSAYFTCN